MPGEADQVARRDAPRARRRPTRRACASSSSLVGRQGNLVLGARDEGGHVLLMP
ncbi:MAG: hypothetical protein KIT58_03680 [Planctomycetota bacterium]|nr:hypothetical protein [Planctomycetota bacterium]